MKHGARIKRCCHKGCTNNAKKGGVCIRLVPKLRDAVTKDVPNWYRMEEFVSGTVHHGQNILAAMKDVPNWYRMEEFVSDMVQK